MEIVSSDKIFVVQPPQRPDYKSNNPLGRLMGVLQKVELSAEREHYYLNQVQYLLPFGDLELYGPSSPDQNVTDVRLQDNKQDFQKQNIRTFTLTDVRLARGWATVDGWQGCFLLLSYRGGPDSVLAKAAGGLLGDRIRVWIQIRDVQSGGLLEMPYNPRTDRYELEIWGYPGTDLRNKLGPKGVAAWDRGGIVCRADLVPGLMSDFAREGLDSVNMRTYLPTHAMHPILPLNVQVAFSNREQSVWDSLDGRNHRYIFGMCYRGWNHFLQVGVSESPHGGFGFLHFRNLLSNYFAFSDTGELAREVEPWMLSADGDKAPSVRRENFLAVDYMDLHVLKAECGIGIHRHRDNQEIFFMMRGTGIMVVGDYYQFPDRERAFEVRTLTAGSFSLLKAGQLHALYNVTDEDLELLMFGGYD